MGCIVINHPQQFWLMKLYSKSWDDSPEFHPDGTTIRSGFKLNLTLTHTRN